MKVILVSVWWVIFASFLASSIWGRMAQRTYDARMRFAALRWFLMPGRLRDRDVWVRSQKVVAWFGLVVISVVYALALISILS
jgi:hypothetical protein